MNKNIWGPDIWNFIHIVTINYPILPSENDKQLINNFFSIISETLPCEKCREHFKLLLNNFQPDNISRETLFKWGVDIHNKVNKRIGKKVLSHEKVKKIYEKKYNMKINFNSENTFKKSYRTFYNILLVLLILIFIFLYFKK